MQLDRETCQLPWLLEGVIARFPTRFPGLGQIEGCIADRFASLLEVPGLYSLAQSARQEEIGHYIPHNLFHAGRRPGTLEEYPPDPTETTPSGLRLFDHQRRTVTFLRRVSKESGGAILGADPGLAKTIASLQALWLDGYLQHGGIVCGPLGARSNWCDPEGDAQRYMGLVITPIEGTATAPRFFQPNRWYFIHYDIIEWWHSQIAQELQPRALIIDESHTVCNPRTRRHQAVATLSAMKSIERRYLLTGTPIPKDRMDLHGQLTIAQPNQWGSFVSFGIRACGGHKMSFEEGLGHWVFDGRTNTQELRARLAGVYLRYTKADVAGSLPVLHRHRIEVQLDEEMREEYMLARRDVLKYRAMRDGKVPLPTKLQLGSIEIELPKESPKGIDLVVTSTLKSILDRAKLKDAKRVIQEHVVGKHRRTVIYTWQRASAKQLVKDLEDVAGITVFGPIDGSMPWEHRLAEAAKFAVADRALFVATRGSVGIAINALSAADSCLQITPDWNPDSNIQAESRIHRTGNPWPEVHSYYMIAPKTLDDRVLELIRQKADESRTLAECDVNGWHLAADLDPTGTMEERWSLDEICAMLGEIQEL